MEERSSSGLLTPSAMPALSGLPSYRGSSVTLPNNAMVPEISGSICGSTPSMQSNAGVYVTSGSPFAWDADCAHSHALISPVHLGGKKKGGLLSGLKKMFQPKADGRAATGEGRRDGAQPDLEGSVNSSDGAGFLDVSVTKVKGSLKAPIGLKVQVGSSRDLSLAALLTSPVRAPAAPGSPAVLNSPMPSMRLEHAYSSNLAAQDAEFSSGSSEQRLFPNFGRNGSSRPPGIGSSGGQAYGGQLAASMSSHLPSPKLSAAQQQQQHGALQKSLSTALPNPNLTASTGNGVSQPLVITTAEEYQQFRGGAVSNSGRIALPYITSPRNQDQQQPVSSPGRLCCASPLPEMEPPASTADAAEEEDDLPGSVLLGMNPAVPHGMRRRRWCLDDYQVVKRMYKGATSAVYRAACLRSGLTVALKVYFLSRVPINVVHMIRREIELHVPLVHRNIVMLYAAFQDEKHIVLVEEFAARGDLFGIHRSMNCRLTETQTSELILAPFLDALLYLHSRGIMHRDIKPENILFTNDWALKIADFGVSINVHDERAVTRTGTADYMAPEVERCPLKHAPDDNKDNPNLAYTTAIDIWSVGVLAYEMLVGFPPFVANGAAEEGGGVRAGVAAFMAEQATRKTLRFPASVSAAAKDFIMVTLNESPTERPTAPQLLKHPWLFKVARRPSMTSTSRFSNTNLANH